MYFLLLYVYFYRFYQLMKTDYLNNQCCVKSMAQFIRTTASVFDSELRQESTTEPEMSFIAKLYSYT